MPAYMMIAVEIDDRDRFINDYGAAAAKLVERFGGRYLLMRAGAELLEGDFGDDASVVISEWPDKAAALAFWNSPEYKALVPLREGISRAQVLLVEAPKIGG